VHFTPTYSSWLNQVEIWFNRITQQAIRRGTFRNVKDLVQKIDHYVQSSNRQASPFVWTVTADSILGKVERLYKDIYGTTHWARSYLPMASSFRSQLTPFQIRHRNCRQERQERRVARKASNPAQDGVSKLGHPVC
jgi:hypothetical protein